MEIGNKTNNVVVWTPYDALYPQFDSSWRHGVAKGMVDNANWMCTMPEISKDPWVRDLRDYLGQCRKLGPDGCLDKRLWPYRYIMAWHDSGNLNQIRFRLEALLLTGAPFDVISMDLAGGELPPQLFQLYERIFFNVRNKDGRLHDSSFIRMNAALPGGQALDRNTPEDVLWKYIGMRYGYTGLVWYWGMPEPHGKLENDTLVMDELWRTAQAIMMESVLRRTINNFDLNHNLGQYIDYQRMRHETGKSSQKENQAERLLLQVLQKFAPTMLKASAEIDKQHERTEAIRNRLAAQANVAQQVIPDFGKDVGLIGIDNYIKQHFKDADLQK